MTRLRHTTKPCPACQQTLVRVRRAPSERGAVDPASGAMLGRYRCANLDCGWQGLLPRSPRRRPASRSAERGWPAGVVRSWRSAEQALPWARAGSVLLVMALLALVGVQGTRHLLMAPAPVAATVPVGESHDGDPLPARHPWVRPVSSGMDAVAAAASAPDGATAGAPPQPVAPLAMRRGCAWGQPGRNPYRGTVEQALVHARLPPEVVTEVSRRVRSGETTDRLEIRTGRIHGVRHGREFDPRRVALTFGQSLCLNSRVNFAPGHVERADLYEVRDARGLRHAVMVPDVCGNVSVLGVRGERRLFARLTGDPGADPDTDQAWWALATAAAVADGTPVPEPGTLAAALVGLAALAWAGRRRSRPAPAACDAQGPRSPR